MDSIIAIQSITVKNINEDYIETFQNDVLQIRGFILGDGIGSHYMSHEGSLFCVQRLKFYIEGCGDTSDFDLETLFYDVTQDLKKEFHSKDIETDITQCYGTTLICVVEYINQFTIAYLGNGSIWHFRGNFSRFSAQRYFPWNVMNLLNPHTLEEGGKESLYKFISLGSSDFQVKPTILTLQKDNEIYGDILLVSTDGLSSNDHNPVAKDPDGNIWIAGDRKIELFIHTLKGYFGNEQPDTILLKQCMVDYQETILGQNLVDDDLTYGILITPQAILSHKK